MDTPRFARTLPKGGVLWWQGDPAASLAVVEKGCLAVRVGERLLDVALTGTVLGESALLAEDAGRRTANVVALEPESIVIEHPVASLRETFDTAVGTTVLRTLLYQVARNALLVRAAHADQQFVGAIAEGLMATADEAHKRVASVRCWEDFSTAFRLAYRLRECSDQARAELVGAGSLPLEKAHQELAGLRAKGFASELASAVEGFLVVWASLPG
jgi:CRP-like cAMP-binding protein